MAERSSYEQLAETLKTLLSSNSFKIEPPTVMATSPALNVRFNVYTLLNVVYDLLTRDDVNKEKLGLRHEERSAQTLRGATLARGVKGSFVSVGVQAEDLSEVEERQLLERQNQILTRSIRDCHMQYIRHKSSCSSCPPLTFPKELQEVYQQTPGANYSNLDDAAERLSDSPQLPSPLATDGSVSSDSDCKPTTAIVIPMDVDPDVPPPESMDTSHSHSSEIGRFPSISSYIVSSRSSPVISTHQTTASLGQPANVEDVDASDEKPVLDLTLSPNLQGSQSPTGSDTPELDISQEDEDEEIYDDPEPRPKVVVSELWWREQLNEVVMNRFLGTRLLECGICETPPNPSYKSFNDDEEDVNEQIQVHFEEVHPDESYALKRCSNVQLKIFGSLR